VSPTETGKAAEAVSSYADHPTEPIALPELVDAVAFKAQTTANVAKRAIFRAMDDGQARFTPDFKVAFARRT
jgi:hypothetical protein